MFKCVKFLSRSRLSGGECQNAPFILCLGPNLVKSPECPGAEIVQPFSFSTLEVKLKDAPKCHWVCDAMKETRYQVYEYSFIYNTEDLADGVTALGTKDVLGAFHKGCFAKWVEEIVGEEPYIVTTEDGQSFVSPHGCVYPLNSGCCWVAAYTSLYEAQQISFEDPYYITSLIGPTIINPFSDSTLVFSGGYEFQANVESEASVSGTMTVEASINGQPFALIGGPPRSADTNIKTLFTYTGLIDAKPGSLILPSATGTISVQCRISPSDPADQVFGGRLSLNIIAHRLLV